ncbi:hypothetical protein BDV38DRAFT_48725 [Aspergillus pseudotamarii]|uniref:Transmembrane protein n=1 Tax=Aspergillus pseudotamarii TaxID=132259 RepID=A0A5N6S7Z8_ASPPS|nr:uncharacterized protein BDV38DRAFT_48725 [Aspergillus pseudotamarii]KAE8130742.1 hypothetical protein BDV38DRAFT_48725 [Aspergillus pseudotamarii]
MFRLRRILPNSTFHFRVSPPLSRTSNLNNVRHVKFKRPWFRRFLTTFFIYGTAFHLWSSFVLLQFDDTLDDADAKQEGLSGKAGVGENQKDDTEGRLEDPASGTIDSDPVFIPLGWPRLRKGELYAASDQEWQEFVKISRDREKLQCLRDELASIVQKDASQSELLSRVLGGPLSVTGFWLVHHFPSRAPPDYRRSGLEFTDGGMSWVSKPMSLEDGDRLRRCVQPLSVALAIKDAYMILVKRQLSRLSITGLEQEQAPGTSSLPPHKALSSELQPLDKLHPMHQSETHLTPPTGSQEGTLRDKGGADLHPSLIISTLQRLPLPKFGPGSDLYAASLAFKMRLKDGWAQELHRPRRGGFYFIGPVGLKGPRGFCRVEVKGEYDPATASWSLISMQLKDVSIFNQKALGGP